eukprot:SAG11_NODE_6372_length_1327_cov_1.171824_1_plen_191_part_00
MGNVCDAAGAERGGGGICDAGGEMPAQFEDDFLPLRKRNLQSQMARWVVLDDARAEAQLERQSRRPTEADRGWRQYGEQTKGTAADSEADLETASPNWHRDSEVENRRRIGTEILKSEVSDLPETHSEIARSLFEDAPRDLRRLPEVKKHLEQEWEWDESCGYFYSTFGDIYYDPNTKVRAYACAASYCR